MLKRLALTVMMLSMITACASTHSKQDANPAYASHQFSNHEVAIAWKAQETDKGVRIDGTVQNVRQDIPYTSLQLTAKLLDAKGKVMAKETKTFSGRFAGTEPFTIEIPVENKQCIDELDFSYSYGRDEDFYKGGFRSVP
ncbi:MAG: hypothetical protein FPO08_11105 [Geobacter sp.]|nr:MAG: hypothetical protein FPO08_11105 [Geobacter sp.]